MFLHQYSKEGDELIQKAITFLVENFNKTGHNPKPVIIHTMRVAMYLYAQGQSVNVIVTALLHDIVEDTQVPIEEVEEKFGPEVAKLVLANTFKSDIEDYVQKYIDTFERNIAAGSEAALVKASDLLDNSYFYHLGAQDTWAKLYGKFSKFVEMSQPLIGDTQVWKDLVKRQEELKTKLNIS